MGTELAGEVAGDLVALADLQQRRLDLRADLLGELAAGAEPAARRRVDRARHVALEADALATTAHRRLLHVGHRGEQCLGVGVVRAAVDRLAVTDLHDLAEVHHGDLGAEVTHDGQVVGDEEERHVELALDVLEQVDDLRLDRDVERRDRLVRDEHLRVQRQRAGDADALALAAGELVGVAVVVLGVEAHDLQQLLDAREHLVLRDDLVHLEGRTHDRADRVTRVQRGVGVLEDHLHVAAQRLHLLVGELGQVVALEHHRAAGRLVEPGDQATGRRLAAAGLADQAQRAALGHLEGDAVHGLHVADGAAYDARGAHREVHLEVVDRQHGRRVGVEPGGRVSQLGDRVGAVPGDLVGGVGVAQLGGELALAGLGGVGADLGRGDLGVGVGVLGHRVSSTRSGAISGSTSDW